MLISIGFVKCSKISIESERNNTLTFIETPFKIDVAIAFFREAHQYKDDSASNNFSKQQCLSDLDKIYEGIRDYQEWALECKYTYSIYFK